MNREAISCGQIFASVVGAGTRIFVKTLADSSGACLFAWSAADPFDQLSDAHTFMELRRAWPRVKDRLFSTCRRPLLEILSDSASPAIDLLRHDAWIPRQQMLEIIGRLQPDKEFPAPGQLDWPFSINLFCRTQVDREGALTNIPEAGRGGHQIQMRAMTDIALVLIGASHDVSKRMAVIEVSFSGQEAI
jgi:uncharacterized protein YcgI (DUF1989 family)